MDDPVLAKLMASLTGRREPIAVRDDVAAMWASWQPSLQIGDAPPPDRDPAAWAAGLEWLYRKLAEQELSLKQAADLYGARKATVKAVVDALDATLLAEAARQSGTHP